MSENNFKINEHSLRTAISKVEPDKIVTRGYNQRDLIEKIRYSDMVFLLLKGRLPSIKEGKLFNHVLVSFFVITEPLLQVHKQQDLLPLQVLR